VREALGMWPGAPRVRRLRRQLLPRSAGHPRRDGRVPGHGVPPAVAL